MNKKKLMENLKSPIDFPHIFREGKIMEKSMG